MSRKNKPKPWTREQQNRWRHEHTTCRFKRIITTHVEDGKVPSVRFTKLGNRERRDGSPSLKAWWRAGMPSRDAAIIG